MRSDVLYRAQASSEVVSERSSMRSMPGVRRSAAPAEFEPH
jgi:hypothetical protein